MELAVALAALGVGLYFGSLGSPKPDVLVSLTTSPRRIARIGPLLAALSAQTVAPRAIVLNLPRVFKRTGERFGTIPAFVTSNPLVKVNWVDDVGPATKLVPAVALAAGPETVIITVDDDIEYRATLVESMLSVSAAFPGAVVTGQSYRSSGLLAELVEGYSSVLYKARFLDGLEAALDPFVPCYLADDLVISNFLRARMVPVVRAAALGVVPFGEIYLDYGERSDALKHGAGGLSEGNLDNYAKCAAHLTSRGEFHLDPY